MAITRNQQAKELVPGLNKVLGKSYGLVDNDHTVLFESEKSGRAFEEEVMFTGLGAAPVKAEGAAVVYDDAQETWTARYTMQTIALAFAMTEEAMEDNLYESISSRYARYLGRSMAVTKQLKAAQVYNRAFDSAYKGGDGVALCSASHPTIDGGTQSNTVSVDMSETALENAITSIEQMMDDRGILIGSKAQSLHIPPALVFPVRKILESDLSTSVKSSTSVGFGSAGDGITNVNDKNILSQGFFPGGVHNNRRFTDSDAWFIRTDVMDGMKHFTRIPLSFAMEGDFDTGNGKYKARERYAFGWSDWRQVYGSAGA